MSTISLRGFAPAARSPSTAIILAAAVRYSEDPADARNGCRAHASSVFARCLHNTCCDSASSEADDAVLYASVLSLRLLLSSIPPPLASLVPIRDGDAGHGHYQTDSIAHRQPITAAHFLSLPRAIFELGTSCGGWSVSGYCMRPSGRVGSTSTCRGVALQR